MRMLVPGTALMALAVQPSLTNSFCCANQLKQENYTFATSYYTAKEVSSTRSKSVYVLKPYEKLGVLKDSWLYVDIKLVEEKPNEKKSDNRYEIIIHDHTAHGTPGPQEEPGRGIPRAVFFIVGVGALAVAPPAAFWLVASAVGITELGYETVEILESHEKKFDKGTVPLLVGTDPSGKISLRARNKETYTTGSYLREAISTNPARRKYLSWGLGKFFGWTLGKAVPEKVTAWVTNAHLKDFVPNLTGGITGEIIQRAFEDALPSNEPRPRIEFWSVDKKRLFIEFPYAFDSIDPSLQIPKTSLWEYLSPEPESYLSVSMSQYSELSKSMTFTRLRSTRGSLQGKQVEPQTGTTSGYGGPVEVTYTVSERCNRCLGSGEIVEWDRESRIVDRLYPDGFDSAGNAKYKRVMELEYYPIKRTRTCPACSGSGQR